MTVFCEVHKGRSGFLREKARDAMSAPLASSSAVQPSKRSSISSFSVSDTQRGRCKEQSQSEETCVASYSLGKSETFDTGEEGDVEVEARGVEGPIVGVAVGGFEITGGVKVGGVPEAATEVGE